MMANKKPRKVRKTHRVWHRDNSSVGGFLWKGPTCTKRGLVDHMIWGESDLTLTRPRALFVRKLGDPFFSGSLDIDVGESTISCSISFSSRSATSSLYRMRKNAPRKDITAANEINCHRKVKMVIKTYMHEYGLVKRT